MTEDRTTVFSKTPAPDPLIGRVINDRFKVTGLIARGGMGKVYRAEQAPLGRVCALKVLSPSYDGDKDPEFRRRFFLEASVVSRLTHPNTVTIFDYGRTDDDIFYMAMEYLEGFTLFRAIRQAGAFGEARSSHVARQICRSLREAHSRGVIHRDLKSANVFLVAHGDEPDFAKVLDFGLVKNVVSGMDEDLTKAGLFMGSPKYMAPEQVRDVPLDARTDIYALGIVLFEMMVGRVPFDGPNAIHILTAQLNEPAPRVRQANPGAEISDHLEDIIAKCLAKNPDHRFGSMDELLGALRQIDGQAETHAFDLGSFVPPAPTSSTRVLGPVAMPAESAPSLPRTSAPSSAPKRSRRALAGALVGAVAGVAILGYASFRPSGPSSAGTAWTSAASVTGAPASASSRVAATGGGTDGAKIRITSVPEGASVREDGVEVCSSTPCDLRYTGAEANPEREHALAIGHPGYRVESRVVKLGDGSVDVRLTRVADTPRAVAAPSAKADKLAPPAAGYKTDFSY